MGNSVQISFRTAVVQQTGRDHLQQQAQCEDIVYTRRTRLSYFCGLADGQSKCRHCAVGARESLIAVADYLEGKGIRALSSHQYTDEIQFELVWVIRRRLERLAEIYGVEQKEFSSTLLALALDLQSGLYTMAHLGDGCTVGVRRDGSVHILSAPDNGVTGSYTWLTTSEAILPHLRIYFGNVNCYRRLCFMTDGADCICKGKSISPIGRELLLEADPEGIRASIRQSAPADDASCIMLDFK